MTRPKKPKAQPEAELFRSALETFCVPLSEDELHALLEGEGGEQGELFASNGGLPARAAGLGYVVDRYAPEPAFYKLAIPLGQVPAKVRRLLGLAGQAPSRVRHAVEQMILTTNPAKVIDRAARGTQWHTESSEYPFFEDRDGLRVDYRDEGTTLDKLRESVLAMDPRTADAWRLLTAKSLMHWSPNQHEPPMIESDVRELAEAMGYKKKKKGGYDPRTLQKVAQAMVDLERMHLVIPRGMYEFPINPSTGRNRKTLLSLERTYRVVLVSAKEELRDLFGTRYPLMWRLRLGEWATAYPKQFGPILGNLVELSVKGADLWAKNLGMELIFHYRERRFSPEPLVLRVRTMLERAGLDKDVEEMRRSRNARRAREYFEEAMETLVSRGAISAWNYHPDDEPRLGAIEPGRTTGLEDWLSTRVVVTPPRLPELGSPTPN